MNNAKIIFVQPALPRYRVDFFKRLYTEYGDNLKVYYASSDLNYKYVSDIRWASCTGKIYNYYFGFFVQPGIRLNIRAGDVVVISGNIRNLTSLRIFISASFCGASIVWWGHYKSAGGSHLGLFLRKIFMRSADAVLFYVDGEVKKFVSSFTRKKSLPLTCALSNGIDITEIGPLVSDYIIKERDIDFIFIGRLTEKAAVCFLLDALSRVDEKFNLHIVGDGLLKPSLIEKASELGLTDRIFWHGAVSDERKISILMNRSKVFIYPGQVGLSLIHAMAYGLPAVLHSFSEDQMPEFEAFENGVTGFSFKHNNIESLVDVMQRALSDPDRLREMSKNSLARIGPNFTTQGMARRFCSLVDILKSRN